MKIELTNKQIDAIVLQELQTQRDHCDDETVILAAQVLLDWYKADQDLEKQKEAEWTEHFQGRDSNSLDKGW